MIVLKFGGSSVADAEGIRRVCAIVAARRERRPVVVVSALGGITDLLVEATAAAGRGDLAGQEAAMAGIERRHRWALSGCLDEAASRQDGEMVLADSFDEIKLLLRSIRTLGELSPRAADAVLAFGELLSSRLLASALSAEGVEASWVDPGKVVVTDGNHGAATPDLARMADTVNAHVLSLVDEGRVPVIGGFVGSSPKGVTTTLGRGGGDTTAAVIGAAGKAEEIQIWTDVDGLMTADPRLAADATLLDQVSFGEASEMASFGARVLHPASVSPAVSACIPVHVLNSRKPEQPGTVVLDHSDSTRRGIVSLASRTGLTALFLEADRGIQGPVFRRQAMDLSERFGRMPELVQVSAVGAVAVFRDGDADLARGWAGLGKVRCVEHAGIVAAVGENLREDPVLAGEICRAMGAMEPMVLCVGAAALSVVGIFPQAGLETVVKQLHGLFFREVTRR